MLNQRARTRGRRIGDGFWWRATIEVLAVLLSAGACGGEHLDRIPLPDPPPDRRTVVSLTSFPLESDTDFDRLDNWLRASGSVDDTIKVYNDLLRLHPDHVKAHVRAALAILALDEERGRAVARGVLERFRDRIETDADLQALSGRIELSPPAVDPSGGR